MIRSVTFFFFNHKTGKDLKKHCATRLQFGEHAQVYRELLRKTHTRPVQR